VSKTIVGADAHIGPQKKPAFPADFLRIRNIFERADVGIGPYGFEIQDNLTD